MSREDFELLQRADIQLIIEENIDNDPAQIALQKGVPAAVATQIKYLQRARTKLPRYYHARCILPPRAFEQASSEQVAAQKHFTGRLCIDLTCGLGVDSAHFARHFERVIALERDELLADITRYNFNKLGMYNIEVINTSSADFLASTDLRADLIYADPDRRDAADKRRVLLQDCSPDIVALHTRMHEIAPHVVIKTSPLFDPAEAFRIFGNHTRVTAISLRDECKEILIETGAHIPHKIVGATAIDNPNCTSVEWPLDQPPPASSRPFAPPYRYLIQPDVSLRKMRMACRFFLQQDCFIASETGYAFADKLPETGLYRAYEITEIHEYKPKALRGILPKHTTILQRDFPLSNAQIAAQLHIKEGGTQLAAFFAIDGRAYVAFLLPLTTS